MGNPLWGISLNALTATRERPIFSPSRRPPAPTPPAPVVMASPPPPPTAPEEIPLKLVGTIVGGDNSIAICFNPSTRDVVRLKVGESFQGWFLRAVHGREAAFEKATLHVTLALPSPEDQQVSALPMLASSASAAYFRPTPRHRRAGRAGRRRTTDCAATWHLIAAVIAAGRDVARWRRAVDHPAAEGAASRPFLAAFISRDFR